MRDDSKINWAGAIFGMVFVIAGLVGVYSTSDVLDRIMFLFIFVGFGALITWASLRKGPTPEERLRNERLNGIPSIEKRLHWIIGGFGSVFFFLGASATAAVLPDVIREGNYAALSVLVFLGIGVGILGYAFKTYLLFNKFGPTPLSLDPHRPCVGGQFGGSFEISLPVHKFSNAALTNQPKATARLRCTSISRSGKNSSRSIVWQEEADVYLQQSSKGYKGQLLLEIPEDVLASTTDPSRNTIEWELKIDVDFGTEIGKLERSWAVELLDQSHDAAETKSSHIAIPDSFKEISEKAAKDRANESAMTQVPLTEESQYIHLTSDAKRHTGSKLAGISFGTIFASVGIFTVFQDWGPGYLLILIGAVVAMVSIFQLGKSIEIKIDKHTSVLYTRESWMRMVYSRTETEIQDLSKFKIKKTSSTQSGDKFTEYYKLYFKTESKKIRIADAIEGKKAAEALKHAIIERLDDNEDMAKAA